MTDRADIWIEELDPPFVRMGHSVWPWQTATRISRRAAALGRNYSRGWHCAYCGELMPEWKRIDAKYCKEGCRKMAARKRRERKIG
ncbi:hypothetical protein [Ruegeria sp. EL01]|uniref:hypothetical protein n=1 Tax=Ruegeria sp. EL01 TaxID=2107578 RepID=UPI0013C466F6|nr:hypothetical protein [Ruegeria sp. EL01]